MPQDKAYYEQVNLDNEMKIREILKELPPFCKEFFIGMEAATQSRTRLAYAYDLRIFFRYLYEEHRTLGGVETKDFTAENCARTGVSVLKT